MQITARIDYAVRAMLALAAAEPATLKSTELAESQDLPVPFLHTILADLRRARLVYSVRGMAGGYSLARPSDSITVADVLTALDGDILGVRGLQVAHTRDRGAASNLHSVWLAADEAFRGVLRGITLADLVKGSSDNVSRGVGLHNGVSGSLLTGFGSGEPVAKDDGEGVDGWYPAGCSSGLADPVGSRDRVNEIEAL